jgi:hypothetical protein
MDITSKTVYSQIIPSSPDLISFTPPFRAELKGVLAINIRAAMKSIYTVGYILAFLNHDR